MSMNKDGINVAHIRVATKMIPKKLSPMNLMIRLNVDGNDLCCLYLSALTWIGCNLLRRSSA